MTTPTLCLLPQPKSISVTEGAFFKLPTTSNVAIESHELGRTAESARDLLNRAKIVTAAPGVDATLTPRTDAAMKKGGYTLDIFADGIALTGQSPEAAFHGFQTFRQIVEQSAGILPCLRIEDWPDFQDRGIYYDVCRGRVPTLASLTAFADQLAKYKINQLQLYVEHTFAFQAHPDIGKGASPLTAEDILHLDAYCAERGIELLPSLATFGHLATVLHHKQYHHLAEDLGIGKYEGPADEIPHWFKGRSAWTLSPAVPEIYNFLDSLFAEFLPLFRSKRFNICCDETLDLGYGQSYELCQRKGKGVVYLKHIKKVRKLAKKYDKKIMFWGDIIRHYPELIKKIPSDVTVLDWGYAHDWPFKKIKDFKQAGLPFYACPGTSSWVSLFPRLPEAEANIRGFAKAGKKNNASGLLVTDWGDGGHYNFMEYSWHGYLLGAEMGWNTKAPEDDFTRRFATCFLKTDAPDLIEALTELGRISHLGGPAYQSIWYHILFAGPTDNLFSHQSPVPLSEIVDGEITRTSKSLNAELAAGCLPRILKTRETLTRYSRKKNIDPQGVIPYWVFAADTLILAVQKLEILGPGGSDSPEARGALARDMEKLMNRFEKLWMARNRRSEIRITLKRYKKAIAQLK